MPFNEKAAPAGILAFPYSFVKGSADLDQPFIRQLSQQVEHIAFDHPGRSLVASTQVRDQVLDAHRCSQLAPYVAADLAESVTTTALQTHEHRLPSHIRSHRIGFVTNDRAR